MFFIIEQGNRIQTPVGRLLADRTVSPVSASQRVRPISSDMQPDAGAAKAAAEHAAELARYRQAEDSPQERQKAVFAHQVMSHPVVTASMAEHIDKVWALFANKGFHHLPLLNAGGVLSGIVSDRDLLRFAANQGRAIGHLPIEQVMNTQVISAAPETEIRAIAEVMCGRSIGAVPIVDEQSVVVGIVTRTDILRTLVRSAPIELWA